MWDDEVFSSGTRQAVPQCTTQYTKDQSPFQRSDKVDEPFQGSKMQIEWSESADHNYRPHFHQWQQWSATQRGWLVESLQRCFFPHTQEDIFYSKGSKNLNDYEHYLKETGWNRLCPVKTLVLDIKNLRHPAMLVNCDHRQWSSLQHWSLKYEANRKGICNICTRAAW